MANVVPRLEDAFGRKQVITLYKTVAGDDRAAFAAALLERWGMVCAQPDGEDSAGRQRLRLMTPAELVERACQVTEAAFAEFRKRDWLLDLPVPPIPNDK